MEYYLAPLEGITGHLYRNTVKEFFGDGISKYFTPFFQPHRKRTMASREVKDILPENNEGIFLVPQILTVNAEDFLQFEREMAAYGYRELNLNLGCPSGTVTAKGRGAAFLGDLEGLSTFLSEVFEKTSARVSVKTRIGVERPEEFQEILGIYNRFPIHELIIHPRVKAEMYRGTVHMDIFRAAEETAEMPLCYNGDIWKKGSVPELSPRVTAVMCGRGMVADPSLIRQIAGGKPASKEELGAFMEVLFERYRAEFSGDTPVLHKMKEIWALMERNLPGKEKEFKKLYKVKTAEEYRMITRRILGE